MKAKSKDRKKVEALVAKQTRGEKLTVKDREFIRVSGGFFDGNKLAAVPKKHKVDAKILEAAIAQRDAALKRAHEEYENTQKMMTQRDDAQAEVRKATADWNEAQRTIQEYKTVEADLIAREASAIAQRDAAQAAQKREIERIQESVTNAEKIWCAQRDRHQAQIRAQADEIEKLKSTQAAPQRIGDVIVYVLRNKATGAFEDAKFQDDSKDGGRLEPTEICQFERIAINMEETRDFAREKLNPVEQLAVFGEAE